VILVIDGPEKAGKSTLIRSVSRQFAIPPLVRQWGPVTSYRVYSPVLRADMEQPGLVIWDRSWASEWAYNKLLDRGRVIPEEGLFEYEFRAQAAGGMLVMVDTDVRYLDGRRVLRVLPGETDLPVSPEDEARTFRSYAIDHGWNIVSGEANPDQMAAWIVGRLQGVK